MRCSSCRKSKIHERGVTALTRGALLVGWLQRSILSDGKTLDCKGEPTSCNARRVAQHSSKSLFAADAMGQQRRPGTHMGMRAIMGCTAAAECLEAGLVT